MTEFAVRIEGEDKGYWVLAVDSVTEKLLIATQDQTLKWVPMKDCKVIKAASPEIPRQVVMVQPKATAPRLEVPSMTFHGKPGGN